MCIYSQRVPSVILFTLCLPNNMFGKTNKTIIQSVRVHCTSKSENSSKICFTLVDSLEGIVKGLL